MLYTEVTVALLLALPKSALGDCTWSPCKLKIDLTNQCVKGALSSCESGYICVPEFKECGNKVFGAYTSKQHMCCKGCTWWDVNCNWDAIKEFFQEATDNIKNAWSKLSEDVKDKLTTSENFQRLSTAELTNLNPELLSELRSVIGMLPEQLESIKDMVVDRSFHLQHFLGNINITTLSEGVATLASSAQTWAAEQVTMLKDRLTSNELWGPIANWAASNISSLGKFLNGLDLDTITNFTDSALAYATSIATLSVEKINGLTDKFGNMIGDHFDAALERFNISGINAAMLSQCEIQCESDEDLAWFTDPSSQVAADALKAYARRVKEKVSASSLAYADSFCSGGAGDVEHAKALYANVQAAAVPCNGSASKTNSLRQTFEQWSNSQATKLIERLTGESALGPLKNWSDERMAAVCHQFAAFTPSNIAEVVANTLVSSADEVALIATFGFFAPVADYALSKAADSITPQQREAWAAKLKDGLGNITAWGCEQVASLQTMVAGLKAEDLPAIASGAIKGLKANAITAMSAAQLSGFEPEQMVVMLEDVRQRIHGYLAEELDSNQLVAAVCGTLFFPSGNESACPPAAVDLSMSLPSIGLNRQDIMSHFSNLVPGLNTSDVQVLMMVPQRELPTTANANVNFRRLASSSDNTEVAIRIGVKNPKQKAEVAASVASAANNLTQRLGGDITEDVVSYNVDPSLTTTTEFDKSTEFDKLALNSTPDHSSFFLVWLLVSLITLRNGYE